MSRFTNVLCAVAFVCCAAVPVRAEQASITLFPDQAVWNTIVTATIAGEGGCALAGPPQVHFQSGQGWLVDIDLNCASTTVEIPFSTTVSIGPLPEADYTVRVFNAIRHVVTPPPPPLDTASLRVYREASVDIDLPEAATDAAPFSLVYRGPAHSLCYVFDPPAVDGRAITATFDDNCPILPIPGPVLFTEEHQLGPLPAGEYDVRVFEYGLESRPRLRQRKLTVHDADGCVPSATALCLQDDRFRVEVDWKDFEGHTGAGNAVPLASGDDSGLFWFFQAANIELTVKVLDGCGYNQGWWVFLSSGSTVEYTVTVTDTKTGRTKEYTNDLGEAAPLVADTAAFSCAP